MLAIINHAPIQILIISFAIERSVGNLVRFCEKVLSLALDKEVGQHFRWNLGH